MLIENIEPMGDSRGHQGTVESVTSRSHLTDGNGAVDFVPEHSHYDKILLGAGSDVTKYTDYQFTLTPGKRMCVCSFSEQSS